MFYSVDVSEGKRDLSRIVADAADALRAGGFVILTGSRGGVPQGHLVVAAEHATADALNFMSRHGKGIVSVSLTAEQFDRLGLQPMTRPSVTMYGASVGVSIEAREGVGTGISTADRARTIAVASSPDSRPGDLIQPGHVIPLRAARHGVLERAGRTEAAVDLALFAGLRPAAAVCEVLGASGDVASLDELNVLGADHGIPTLAVEELVEYLLCTERLVERVGEEQLPTRHGAFTCVTLRGRLAGGTHVALVRGDPSAEPVVMIHRECIAGALGATACRCEGLLTGKLERAGRERDAVLVVVGRDLETTTVLHAHQSDAVVDELDFGGRPTVSDDAVAAQILAELGVRSLVLVGADGDATGGFQSRGLVTIRHEPL